MLQAARGQWRRLSAGTSMDEAKRALAKLRSERLPRPVQRSAGPLTIGELAASYVELRMHLKPSTRRADREPTRSRERAKPCHGVCVARPLGISLSAS